MPGRYLLKRAQSTFSFSPKKEEKRPEIERSLSESSISPSISQSPTLNCTTGPSQLRSVINPNWKDKKEKNSNELRLKKKLLQIEETLESEYGLTSDDLEVPFEFDESLELSLSHSPSNSIITTPNTSCSPSVTGRMMTPLEFTTLAGYSYLTNSNSNSSACGCDPECIDPSLCHSIGSSYKPYSQSQSQSNSRFNSLNNRFICSPIYHNQISHEEAQEEGEEDGDGGCSWENSPKFLNSFPNSYQSTDFNNLKSGKDSLGSTYSSNLSTSNDLSNILNQCGSLIDDSNIHTPGLNRSSTSSSLASTTINTPYPSHKVYPPIQLNLNFNAMKIKTKNQTNTNSNSFSLSPILESNFTQSSSSFDISKSPRSNENTVKSIGFKPQPHSQSTSQLLLSKSPLPIKSLHPSSALSLRLSTISE